MTASAPMHTAPLTRELAAFFYAELVALVGDAALTPANRLVRGVEVLNDALYQATADEPQLFSDIYSRVVYVADKYSLPAYLVRELQALRRLARSFTANSQPTQNAEHLLQSSLHAVALTISHLSTLGIPDTLRTAFAGAESLAPLVLKPFSKGEGQDAVPFLRLTVRSIVEPMTESGAGANVSESRFTARALNCTSEDGEEIRIGLLPPWNSVAELAWPRATLHAFSLRRTRSKTAPEQPLYVTTPDSFVVLEPDYLVDVTDLAECIQSGATGEDNPYLYLLKKFIRIEAKESLVLGSMINTCFDALIANAQADFDAAFEAALLQKPTSLMPLVAENSNILDHLKAQTRPQFATIRATLEKLGLHEATQGEGENNSLLPSVEPSFISPSYGLQGRLDLMVEYADDSRRKRVVELKSSKPPEAASQRAWENNAAQVTCYNLLLDSCFGEHGEARSGDSMIFYSRDKVSTALRDIPNDLASKQRVLVLRNRLIAIEHALSERDFMPLRRINARDFGTTPFFVTNDRDSFEAAYKAASTVERRYFHVFASFVARENWSARLGSSMTNTNGFADLWRRGLAEKREQFSVLSELKLIKERSDFERMHLYFERTAHTPLVTNARVGDAVILLWAHPNESPNPARQALLKGGIRELSESHVLVTLRNKRASTTFDETAQWCVEQDFFGGEFKHQYESLFDFLSAPAQKRELLLGIGEPRFSKPSSDDRAFIDSSELFHDLTPEQRTRLAEVASARDYYLLQGPPGTGKTSRMIRSIAQYLYERTDEHMVLLAFTNRAVDEICDAMKAARLPFLRLGSKDSSAHKDAVLIEQIQGKSIEAAYHLVRESRIIVSTISSFLKTAEVPAMKQAAGVPIQTVVIDEASQVVEPQIVGIMARFERTILVGDEKQLPAVVTQPERGLTTSAEDLNALGIADLRVSLFERLLRRAAEQGWERASGIISRQGRMHSAIQEFPNTRFYAGRLQTLNAWQTSDDELSELRLADERVNGLVSGLVIPPSRLTFLATAPEARTKTHAAEARLTALILRALYEEAYERGQPFTRETVGVITPFRAQIAAITNELRAVLPPEAVPLVTVDTVERYQGSERDTIVMSFAVSHASQVRALQSLSPGGAVDRKLNVALTRARSRLVLLGCAAVLESADVPSEHFRALLAFVRERGGYVDVSGA
jgi:DNA replication ATP-dependent helicase Dna2